MKRHFFKQGVYKLHNDLIAFMLHLVIALKRRKESGTLAGQMELPFGTQRSFQGDLKWGGYKMAIENSEPIQI